MSGRRTAERAKLEGAMMPRSYSPPPAGKRCAVCLLPLGDCTTRTCAHPAGREHAASEVEAVHAKLLTKGDGLDGDVAVLVDQSGNGHHQPYAFAADPCARGQRDHGGALGAWCERGSGGRRRPRRRESAGPRSFRHAAGPADPARALGACVVIDADGIDVSWGGWCPVQAFGTFDGCAVYLRARGARWRLEIGRGPEVSEWDTPLHVAWVFRGSYGDGPDAGWMDDAHVRWVLLVAAAVWRARGGQRADAFSVEMHPPFVPSGWDGFGPRTLPASLPEPPTAIGG